MTDPTTDIIDEATWIASQTNYANLDELWHSDPDLFTALATEWHEDHPLDQLGG